jgi:two-component system phosphate regulon sensor histidine kinase PhoR
VRRCAPRPGFWGELGYRIERALRTAETEVKQERERLQQFLSAIEASPNGVLLLDAGGQIDWCNSVAAEHFGLDPGARPLASASPTSCVTGLCGALAGRSHRRARGLSGPCGRGHPVGAGAPYGEGMRLVLSQDITERERAEAMRRDFVANVSHEIRTPLTVLAGFLETMVNLPLSEAERTACCC